MDRHRFIFEQSHNQLNSSSSLGADGGMAASLQESH